MSPHTEARPEVTDQPGFRQLIGTTGFTRLLTSRFAAQWGDGAFQAGLGGAVLFNPERAATPMAIAAGLAVLFLPYSLVGPFTGALLDRWDRRRILVVANLLRAVPILLVALAVGVGVAGPLLYLGALVVTGLSRFVLAGLSAALPHVAPPQQLVPANALAATVGSAVTVVGGLSALGLRAVIGPDNTGSAWVTAIAVLGSVIAAAAAAGFRRGQLGPDSTSTPVPVVVSHGLRDGLVAASRVPSVAAGLTALLAHRLSFGVASLVALLLYRNSFASHGLLRAGLSGLCELLIAGATGLLLAAVLSPPLVARFGRERTVRGALVVAGLAILALGLPMMMSTILAAAFVLSTAGQVVKLSLDATVQTDVSDDARGRVFALYDTVFNLGYVLAVAVAATAVPANGHAPDLLLIPAALYLTAAVLHALIAASPPASPSPCPSARHGDISGCSGPRSASYGDIPGGQAGGE
jgi:MFS family permease